MSKWLRFALLALLVVGCRKEKNQQLSEYESQGVRAKVFSFQVYPGAKALPAYSDLLKRAHFVLHPGATSAPPMEVYDTDASLDQVAKWYADKYGYAKIADAPAAPGTTPPQANYTSGDLKTNLDKVQPILQKLNISYDSSKITGTYRGATFQPQVDLPRVSLQRPYVDLTTGQLVDRTLIVMVRGE
jgi:hypothetical protein